MPRKKKEDAAQPVVRHAAVQVSRPDADVYYINEAARERYEAQKK